MRHLDMIPPCHHAGKPIKDSIPYRAQGDSLPLHRSSFCTDFRDMDTGSDNSSAKGTKDNLTDVLGESVLSNDPQASQDFRSKMAAALIQHDLNSAQTTLSEEGSQTCQKYLKDTEEAMSRIQTILATSTLPEN